MPLTRDGAGNKDTADGWFPLIPPSLTMSPYKHKPGRTIPSSGGTCENAVKCIFEFQTNTLEVKFIIHVLKGPYYDFLLSWSVLL